MKPTGYMGPKPKTNPSPKVTHPKQNEGHSDKGTVNAV